MKKAIIGVLFIGASLATGTAAFADTATCMCVGITAQSAYCGNTIGGDHLKKVVNPSDATFKKMLHATAMATFKIQGWALDDTTGWLCWKPGKL